MSKSKRPLESLPPTETLEIDQTLTLVPRVRLNLAVHPVSAEALSRHVDEWKLKRALIDFLATSLSVAVAVPEEDISLRRCRDLKKRRREDPVADGALLIRDLSFLRRRTRSAAAEEEEEDAAVAERKFLDWREHLVEKMDGIELNLEGVRYKLSVALPVSDDFEGMKKDWEESNVFGNRGYSRGGRQDPDTIILKGVPSRWFAEPRVSSKPSVLVTHGIFSSFGGIRNLDVAEDNDLGKDGDLDGGDIVSGLHCKIVVQFEKYTDFCNALKVLCGRSLQKEGSRLKADYEVTWDKNGFFQNSRNQRQERGSRMPAIGGQYRSEAPRRQPYSRSCPDGNSHPKRFKE